MKSLEEDDLDSSLPATEDVATEAERLHAVVAGVLDQGGDMLDDEDREDYEQLRDALSAFVGDGSDGRAAAAHSELWL